MVYVMECVPVGVFIPSSVFESVSKSTVTIAFENVIENVVAVVPNGVKVDATDFTVCVGPAFSLT